MKTFRHTKLHYRYVKGSPSGRRRIISDVNLDLLKGMKESGNGNYKNK